eukprot:1140261-Pelagomonas_calceolata.AAC.1
MQHPWHMARDERKCANTQRDAPQKKDKTESLWKSPSKIQVTLHTLDHDSSTIHVQHTLVAADSCHDKSGQSDSTRGPCFQ